MNRKKTYRKPHITTGSIVTLYRSGKTTYEVAAALGLSQASVVKRLKEANEPCRTRWDHYATHPFEEALRLYAGGMNCCRVAKYCGVTPAAVRSRLIAAGITIRQAKAEPKHGPDNASWKGGRFKRTDGYIWISVGHKRRLPEHRVIMSKHLGRQLTKHEIVHHLNGIRDDNRIENLTLTTLKEHEHGTYVKALQQRIRDLEAFIR